MIYEISKPFIPPLTQTLTQTHILTQFMCILVTHNFALGFSKGIKVDGYIGHEQWLLIPINQLL